MIENGKKKLKIKKDSQYISSSLYDVLENRINPIGKVLPDMKDIPKYDFTEVSFKPF